MTDRLKFLRKIPYFSNIDDHELQAIADIMIERSYDKGRVLFMEGEFGEAVHFVIEGRVKIYKTSENGKEHILYIAGPGDIFAEVILFNEVNYPATAEVMEKSRIGKIRNEDLEQVLKAHPSHGCGHNKGFKQTAYRCPAAGQKPGPGQYPRPHRPDAHEAGNGTWC